MVVHNTSSSRCVYIMQAEIHKEGVEPEPVQRRMINPPPTPTHYGLQEAVESNIRYELSTPDLETLQSSDKASWEHLDTRLYIKLPFTRRYEATIITSDILPMP